MAPSVCVSIAPGDTPHYQHGCGQRLSRGHWAGTFFARASHSVWEHARGFAGQRDTRNPGERDSGDCFLLLLVAAFIRWYFAGAILHRSSDEVNAGISAVSC